MSSPLAKAEMLEFKFYPQGEQLYALNFSGWYFGFPSSSLSFFFFPFCLKSLIVHMSFITSCP